MPFEDWNVGEDLFGDLDKEHDLLDRDVRPFVEECDQLRALQIFSGADDAWGGFAARYIDRLKDEYGKKSIWVWAIEDGEKSQRVCLAYHAKIKSKWLRRPIASTIEERRQQGQVSVHHFTTVHPVCAYHRHPSETSELRPSRPPLALADHCFDQLRP